jgi:hypothetical protein
MDFQFLGLSPLFTESAKPNMKSSNLLRSTSGQVNYSLATVSTAVKVKGKSYNIFEAPFWPGL